MAVAQSPAPHAVILFDGGCLFCQGSVSFIAERDAGGYFRFGASQSAAGRALLEAHGLDAVAARSIVLIEDGKTYLKSTASLRIAQRLRFPWNLGALLLVVPRPIRDAAYDVVAAIRHRIAGRDDRLCEIPPASLRNRLI